MTKCVYVVCFINFLAIRTVTCNFDLLATLPDNSSDLYQDAGESDSFDGNKLKNLSRCSRTELALARESLMYSWDLKGFLGHYLFMKKFDQIFEIKTEEISFKSDIVDGKWFFKVNKMASSGSTEDITLSSTYSYEAKQAKKLNFYLQFSILHNDKEIVLPVQKSTNPIVMQQRLYNRRGYSSYLEYVHTFLWPNLGTEIENILKQYPDIDKEQRMDEYEERYTSDQQNQDITLRFLITAYFPMDPVYSGSENCQPLQTPLLSQGLIRDGEASRNLGWKQFSPPYVKHSFSMLHDDRYSDVTLKVANQTYSAHRIILATCSPVFSSLLDNSTEDFSTGANKNQVIEIQIDENISGDVIEEMLRYIYTGKVALDRIAGELLVVAHKYELSELKKLCEKYLYPRIRAENAIKMYEIGHHVGSSRITKRAFTIMKANKLKIATQLEEFQRLTEKHPALMFQLFVAS